MSAAPQTTVADLKQRLDSGEAPCLLDVREDWELAISRLPGVKHVRLNEIPLHLKELDAGQEIIVICKGGGRSQMAANYLLAQGFGKVRNLQGGMDAWVREIDPGMDSY
jgi:rhodanese-related sulfurtransferase